jgi:hypothetical protein
MSEKDLENLLKRAKHVEMTPSEKEAQRKSFAYGNANIENAAVTKDVIEKAAAEIEEEKRREFRGA